MNLKIPYLILCVLMSSINAYSQFIPFDNLCTTCAPTPSAFTNTSNAALGIEPSFAIISQGIPVDLALTYQMPLEFDVGPPIAPIPVTVTVFSIDLVSIDWGGLAGLSSTPDAFNYDPGVNRYGCINICGTSNNTPGSYTVSVKVYAQGGALGQTGGDTAFVDFEVLVLPPGNPYFSTTPPESCEDTASISLAINTNTFQSLYDLDIFPTEYIWDLPYGGTAMGETPPNFDLYSTEVVTLTANTYEYIVTEVEVTSVNGNWWAGFFDDGAFIGGSEPDLEFNLTNGVNSTVGAQIGNDVNPVWDLSAMPFALTDQAVSISFQEIDPLSTDDGGTYTFTVNGAGNYNFGSSSSNLQGNVTISTQLVDAIVSSDTIEIHPAPVLTNLSGTDTVCIGDSIELSASANFTDFEWVDANGVVIGTDQTVFVKDEGIYFVRARATPSALCLGSSDIFNLYNYPAATLSINVSASGGLEVSNPNGYDLQWFSNGVPIPGATSDQLADLSSGNPFTVTGITQNGCSVTSDEFNGCLAGVAEAPNGTSLNGTDTIGVGFEAVGFGLNNQTQIAWSVTPVADGLITSAADVAGIDNSNIYLGDSSYLDLVLNCNTLDGPGNYYLTPFLIESVDLPEFPFPFSDSTCVPNMNLGIIFDCTNQDWAIGNASIIDPSGSPIDLLALSPIPINYPIDPTLVCGVLGGSLPDVSLFAIAPNSNPNGTWSIEVTNSGTGTMNITVPAFQVSLLAADCSEVTEDMVYDYGPFDISIPAGGVESITVTVPPLPANFPSISNACSAFGEPVEVEITNCVNSIEDILNVENLNLYPNPNNGIFTLDFELYESENVEIAVIDLTGRKLVNNTYEGANGDFRETFDFKNKLNTGFYFLEISIGNFKTQKKFIVK